MPHKRKARKKTYTFEEIMKVMDEELADDTTPPSAIDWRQLDKYDTPMMTMTKPSEGSEKLLVTSPSTTE